MSMQFVDSETATDHGTLLWIGDRDSQVYGEAYDFCESHVAQLAYRKDLASALARPASKVRTILCCRDNDSADSVARFHELCQLHSDAKPVLLLGPLCAGARPSPADTFDATAIRWHEWESFLPAYLRRCGWANQMVARATSIAVVASTHANAAALLAIAAAGSAAAIWCRPEQLASLNHFDQIWWDDSATIGQSWTDLFARLADLPNENIWISGQVTPRTKYEALQAGIDLVIVKPGDYSLLIQRIAGQDENHHRRAA